MEHSAQTKSSRPVTFLRISINTKSRPIQYFFDWTNSMLRIIVYLTRLPKVGNNMRINVCQQQALQNSSCRAMLPIQQDHPRLQAHLWILSFLWRCSRCVSRIKQLCDGDVPSCCMFCNYTGIYQHNRQLHETFKQTCYRSLLGDYINRCVWTFAFSHSFYTHWEFNFGRLEGWNWSSSYRRHSAFYWRRLAHLINPNNYITHRYCLKVRRATSFIIDSVLKHSTIIGSEKIRNHKITSDD